MTLSLAEKQLLSCLYWSKTRYALFLGLNPENPFTKENLEYFGAVWIGTFKHDWEDAFMSLQEKGILVSEGLTYVMTSLGKSISEELLTEGIFFKFEYDYFFSLAKSSEAHSSFCKRVYGIDLSQHGLVDIDELEVLVRALNTNPSHKVVDLGCGNGKITEYLSTRSSATFVGVDVSSEAILEAQSRKNKSSKTYFQLGNMNAFQEVNTYDAILFIDTLYYATDLSETIKSCMKALKPKGKIYAYYSQWIMDRSYKENLSSSKTNLGAVLTNLGLKFNCSDLTLSGINHWKKKLETLIIMKENFISEGNEALWMYRFREAERYAQWGEDMYARYFYEINVN